MVIEKQCSLQMVDKLVDSFGRTIRYLRVSVTDRCNLYCDYCRPANGVKLANHSQLLTLEEVARLVRLFAQLGVDRIRLTGGEPLLRRNITGLVADLARLPGIREIALSTNALLLHRFAVPLREAGLQRVNISLDSLNPEIFARITRGGQLSEVLAGIEAALQAGLQPVKVNMVVMRGVNDHEVPKMVDFARERGVMLRFIETMPIGAAGQDMSTRFVPMAQILDVIRHHSGSELIPVTQPRGSGPARYFKLGAGNAEVGVISAQSRHFCDTCNRMRLTAQGKLVLCLGRDDQMDLKTPMRNGESDDQLLACIRRAVALKPERHLFEQVDTFPGTLPMVAIGG